VVSTTGLQEGLVNTTTSGNDTDGGTSSGEDNLLGTGGELDAGLAVIGVVANDSGVTTGGTGKSTTITNGLLDVADNGTLWHGAQRKNVTDVQGSLLTAVDELTSVGTLYKQINLKGKPSISLMSIKDRLITQKMTICTHQWQ
jgi:hypothetical protein